MCPGHCVVVVGLDAAQLVYSRREEFGRLQLCEAGERSYLVEAALQ
jgi:hypothetical protein